MTDTDTIESYLNDLDSLMAEDPLSLSIDESTPGGRKLSAIILHHRNLRASREAGKGKAVRRANSGAAKLDIKALMGSIVTAAPAGGNIIKRRV